MSQLVVVSGEQNSQQTQTSATYTQTSPVATGFTAGKKYLILARTEHRNTNVNITGKIRLVHGQPGSVTAFGGSEQIFTSIAANDRRPYFYWTIWTAVSGEDVYLELASGDGSNWTGHQYGCVVGVKLTDDLTENTDWVFAEESTPLTLTGSYQDGASKTWTPGTAGHTWLVLGRSHLTTDTANDYSDSQLVQSAGGGGPWEMRYPCRNTTDLVCGSHMWVGTLTAAAWTFKEQAKREGSGGSSAQRTHSAIFALDLSKFDVFAFDATDAHQNTSSGAYSTTVATISSFAQSVSPGNVLVLGYAGLDVVSAAASQYFTSAARVNNVDCFSADGISNSLETTEPRYFFPSTTVVAVWPWVHMNIESLSSGTHGFLVKTGVSGGTTRGVKNVRLLAVSLEVAAAPPTPGAGGAQGALERNEQIMYQSDYVAARRRVLVRCVDATDNVTPESGEANGQGQISVNGGGFTSNGVGVLVAVEASNGLYYAELTAAALATLGSVRYRYKSAATALFSVALAIEECPWINDGVAQSAGANTIGLQNYPTYVAPGSIVRIVSGTGAGQSMCVSSYNNSNGVCTMEGNWDTIPTGAGYVVLPGLPPITPDVNPVKLGGDTTALAKLVAGVSAVLTGAVVSGTNTTTTVTTNLPVTVGGQATPADFYKGRSIYFYGSGTLVGEQALITASAVNGGNTVLTVDILSANPAVGATFVVT